MNGSKFIKSVEIGNAGEKLFSSFLASKRVYSQQNIKFNNKEYDISAWIGNGDIIRTFEIKYDLYATKSGNIAIEYYNPKSDVPSGIQSTKADFWVHILSNPDEIWISRVKVLKGFIEENKPSRIIKCGGDNNASLYLYKKHRILGCCFKRLDTMSPCLVKKILFGR